MGHFSFLLLFVSLSISTKSLKAQVRLSVDKIPITKNNKEGITENFAIPDVLTILGDYLTPRGDDVSLACKESGEYYMQQLQNQSFWAMQMFDADPKFPQAGLMEGNFIHFPGAFDSCLKADSGLFRGKYCLMGLYSPEEDDNPQSQHFHDGRSFAVIPPELTGSGLIKFATCIPSTCSSDDAMFGMNTFLAETQTPGSNKRTFSYTLGCQSVDMEVELSGGDWAMVAFLGISGIIIFVSTLIDMYQRFISKDQFPDHILATLQGFSAYHNTRKLFDTKTSSENLGCINGIRFISMTWVLVGHTLMQFPESLFINNFLTMFSPEGPLSNPLLTVIWNGQDSVDTFFLIGAILLSYLTMKELERSGGGAKMWLMFYIHRYLRLTGVYLVIILFHNTLLKYLAYGPQGYFFDYLVQGCRDNWWANILYINNFVGDTQQGGCLGQTWYMAVDMQFFIISPLIIYSLWKHPKFGLTLCGFMMVLATACPLGLSWATHGEDGWSGDFDNVYIKPWGRFQPYLLGILVGYYLHKTRNETTIAINSLVNAFIWMIAACVAASCIYGLAPYYPSSEKMPSEAEVVIFNGFNRLAWSCAVSWVIIACIKKKGGPVNEFLSWSGFIPLARISYCMYLTHITVVVWYDSVLRNGLSYGSELYAYFSMGNVLTTAAVSVFLVIAFEMPILHLEKLFFSLLGVGGNSKAKRYVKPNNEENKKPLSN